MIGALKDMENFGATSHGVALELKLARSETVGEIVGYGAVFENVDRQGDIIVKGAFAASLAEHKAQKTWPAMLWSHDQSRPIGTWETIREDAKGLYVAGRLNTDVQDGREALSLLQSGALKGLSIGFQSDPRSTDFDRKTGARILKAVMLFEVSLVAIPANAAAQVTGLKSLRTVRDYERFLRDHGATKAFARRLAAGGWPALAQNTETKTGPLLAKIAAATAELKGLSK